LPTIVEEVMPNGCNAIAFDASTWGSLSMELNVPIGDFGTGPNYAAAFWISLSSVNGFGVPVGPTSFYDGNSNQPQSGLLAMPGTATTYIVSLFLGYPVPNTYNITLAYNDWHYITISADQLASSLSLYVNGSQVSTFNIPIPTTFPWSETVFSVSNSTPVIYSTPSWMTGYISSLKGMMMMMMKSMVIKRTVMRGVVTKGAVLKGTGTKGQVTKSMVMKGQSAKGTVLKGQVMVLKVMRQYHFWYLLHLFMISFNTTHTSSPSLNSLSFSPLLFIFHYAFSFSAALALFFHTSSSILLLMIFLFSLGLI
jgi:hypothetical protein